MKKILLVAILIFTQNTFGQNNVEAFIYGDESCELLKTKIKNTHPHSCTVELPDNIPVVVFLSVNSLKGIQPINRTHINKLKEIGIIRFAVVLTNTQFVDDPELLELETLELIESMNAIGLPGDDMPFFLDYEKAPYDPRIPIDKGMVPISKFINDKKYWNSAFKQRK